MKYILSDKANLQIKTLKINPDWVDMTITHPDSTGWGLRGERKYTREYEKHLLTVVVKSKKSESLVVAVSYTKKSSLTQIVKSRFEKFRRSGLIRRFLHGMDVD